MTVAASLTPTGGYQYAIRIHLTESGGVAATVTDIDLSSGDLWSFCSAAATFGPEAWTDGNVIAANGALTSKPLVATEEMPSDYCHRLEARVWFGEGAAVSRRAVSIYADAPPLPQPPPTARFTMTGIVSEGSWAQSALSDVTVEVLNGENAGWKVRTGADGRYTMTGLRPGELGVQFSKAGYVTTGTTVDLKSNRTVNYGLVSED